MTVGQTQKSFEGKFSIQGGANLKILIADDSAFMRRVVIKTLNSAGFRDCIEACDGEEAVEKYKKLMPDLVIMDINMPKKGGIDAAKEMVVLKSDVKIIFLTALDQEWSRKEVEELKAFSYITKPFDKETLVRAVNKALSVMYLTR